MSDDTAGLMRTVEVGAGRCRGHLDGWTHRPGARTEMTRAWSGRPDPRLDLRPRQQGAGRSAARGWSRRCQCCEAAHPQASLRPPAPAGCQQRLRQPPPAPAGERADTHHARAPRPHRPVQRRRTPAGAHPRGDARSAGWRSSLPAHAQRRVRGACSTRSPQPSQGRDRCRARHPLRTSVSQVIECSSRWQRRTRSSFSGAGEHNLKDISLSPAQDAPRRDQGCRARASRACAFDTIYARAAAVRGSRCRGAPVSGGWTTGRRLD